MNPWLTLFAQKITKRFVGFVVAIFALLTAYSYGPTEKFSIFAFTVGGLYGAYVTGQTVTDKAKAAKP